MMDKPILEIAVFNIQSAIAAAAAGADRLELCENPQEGGTTPSLGNLQMVRQKISIPVFPIIRPRGGDFLFTEEEFGIMKKDIVACKELQFEGVVIGLLLTDGQIDIQRTKQLVDLAYPLEVTFHRAFDRCKDPLHALAQLIDSGCTRILTSGQVPNASDGKELIRKLVEQAQDNIIIMPGSGVRSNNIAALANYTQSRELHSSARKWMPSEMYFQNKGMQESLQTTGIDPDEIRAMQQALTSIV
jgi:copper homeostasis protein